MKRIFFALIFAVLITERLRLEAADAFPLLGLWRVTEGIDTKGKGLSPGEAGELEFLPDGVMILTLVSPEKGINKPIRMRWRYTFQPPDVITYTLDGSATERQRFTVRGDQAALEHLDYGTSSKLRRIEHTEFKEDPTDTQEVPK